MSGEGDRFPFRSALRNQTQVSFHLLETTTDCCRSESPARWTAVKPVVIYNHCAKRGPLLCSLFRAAMIGSGLIQECSLLLNSGRYPSERKYQPAIGHRNQLPDTYNIR